MSLEISVGRPQIEGRYVVFPQCASRQLLDWCEPAIATWHGGKWHFPRSVYGWIGPLPVAKTGDLLDAMEAFLASTQEYDL